MKLLRIIGCLGFLLAGNASAQDTLGGGPLAVLTPQAKTGSDTDIQPGVIKVRKPQINSYVKVEYRLYLANVKEVEIVIIGKDGSPYRDKVPVFDSLRYPEKLERMYPKKTQLFSKHYAEQLMFKYPSAETQHTDTMIVGMWIAKNGKIRYVDPDTVYTGDMPAQLEAELYALSMELQQSEWGVGGGYKTPKKFLKPSQPVGESYYCEVYVIVSNKPLTEEQKNTGVFWAPFDIPLNSPPMDSRHEEFLIRNGWKAPEPAQVKKPKR